MANTLGHLVYYSKATVSTDSLWVLTDLLAVSQRNNDRDKVTGALAIADGWFFQVIEGPGSKLNNLLRRLEADTRHTEFKVLSRREVSFRLFGEWSMCSSRITPEIGPDLAGLINECSASPYEAVAALVQIVARRAH
jgi:hypothetical protein